MSNPQNTSNPNLPNPELHKFLQYPKFALYSVQISQMNMLDTLAWLTQAIDERRLTQVITANPIMLMAALAKPKYMEMMRRAELIVPDGTGIVWAAKYLGQPVVEKIAGIELLQQLLNVGETKGWRVFLLGASPETIEITADKLKKRYPLIQFVGVRDGYFSPEEDNQVIQQIREAAPDILFVGRSADNQDTWIDRYKEQLQVPVMMGIGGSFDVLSGKLKRAPKWFIRFHLEWFYRLLQEPWRYRRMLLLPQFVLRVMKDKGKL